MSEVVRARYSAISCGLIRCIVLGYAGCPSKVSCRRDQHIDISVCAHAACWSVLRHYSEQYNIYREFLTHDITLMAHQFDPGGLIPVERTRKCLTRRGFFRKLERFPVHVTRNKPDDVSFYRQLRCVCRIRISAVCRDA